MPCSSSRRRDHVILFGFRKKARALFGLRIAIVEIGLCLRSKLGIFSSEILLTEVGFRFPVNIVSQV